MSSQATSIEGDKWYHCEISCVVIGSLQWRENLDSPRQFSPGGYHSTSRMFNAVATTLCLRLEVENDNFPASSHSRSLGIIR